MNKEQQIDLVNAVARCGNVSIALNDLGITYVEYQKTIRSSPELEGILADAAKFCTDNLNRAIIHRSKLELYNMLTKGQHTITRQEIYKDVDGMLVYDGVKVTKRNSGVPVSAIKLGLELIPDFEKCLQGMIDENALPQSTLEKVSSIADKYQLQLRQAVSGNNEARQSSNQIIEEMAAKLIGRSDNGK